MWIKQNKCNAIINLIHIKHCSHERGHKSVGETLSPTPPGRAGLSDPQLFPSSEFPGRLISMVYFHLKSVQDIWIHEILEWSRGSIQVVTMETERGLQRHIMIVYCDVFHSWRSHKDENKSTVASNTVPHYWSLAIKVNSFSDLKKSFIQSFSSETLYT